MSNHYSAANLRFPGDDARLDFTDIYAFQAPGDAGKTILIINVNPYTTGISAMPPFLMKSEFHPDGVYRINIDNDGDAHADVAFTFVFSEFRHGMQTCAAYYAAGSQARQPEPAGDVLISAAPVGFDAAARPVQAGPGRLFTGVPQRSVLCRCGRCLPRLQVDRSGRVRRQEHLVRSAGGAQGHARRRSADRSLGSGQRAP